jgi:hypothetical protein
MVFGSGLLIMAFILSGGQPITSDAERTVALESETGNPAPCPDTIAGTGSCGCKNTCYAKYTFDGIECTYETCYNKPNSDDQLKLICRYRNPKTHEIIDRDNGLCHY